VRLFGKGRESSRVPGTRLFFATDVHGSDRCFRKFINAGRFYDVDHIILGGDITGKSLVPIERTARGHRAQFLDHRYEDLDARGLAEVEQLIRDHGQYPIVGERDELEALHDEEYRERAFRAAAVAGIARWVAFAEQRLRGSGIRCFVTPGNDDFHEIDAPLQGSDVVEFVEGRLVSLDERHAMITTGYSNRTPWDTPRELDEDALADRIDAMAEGVSDATNLVAVLHAPPRDSELDQAPEIDRDFRVQMEGGSPRLMSVGSSAVRSFVERVQPLIGLHGHVHESKGSQRIGRTLCINPGSEYTEGTLCGALVTLGDGEVLAHQLVVG
jgi:Icc-related predicted phosphoesterase